MDNGNMALARELAVLAESPDHIDANVVAGVCQNDITKIGRKRSLGNRAAGQAAATSAGGRRPGAN
jgi:hypothetical protein